MRTRRPLLVAAIGFVVVAFDFRTDLPDLLPDPVGWLLVAWAATTLGLRGPQVLAVVAAVLSVSNLALPFRYVYLDPETGEDVSDTIGELYSFPVQQRWDTVSDLRAVAIAGAMLVGGVAMWLVLGAVRDRAARAGAEATARRFRLQQWIVPAVWILPTLVLVDIALARNDRYDPVWDGHLEYVGLVGLLAVTWTAVSLARASGEEWAAPPDRVVASPWESLAAAAPSATVHRRDR